MNLTHARVEFLRHLAKLRPADKSYSESARFFSEHASIGQPKGRRYLYETTDYERAALVLANHGVALDAPKERGRRSQAPLQYNTDEKRGAVSPYSDSLAVKSVSGCCILDGALLTTSGHTVLGLEEALRVSCTRLLVVENVETFRFLERARWIDFQGQDVLAVLHGDPTHRHGEMRELLRRRTEPVWAYFDFDPAGLGFASGLPRLERIVLLPEEQLVELARKAQQVELFTRSLPQWGALLERNDSPLVKPWWCLMKQLRLGLSQELMDSGGSRP